ncbi:unnamed protein product [Hymenolepis diminuta]|uniref:Reverse transcriptase domain-containing protein n=1 Tax=Hymenolepis diminuta TaxID=6216 RepID=A0A0R3S8M7_HYMDI|nr:unnamed protein product [Hymenolepis diminuta]
MISRLVGTAAYLNEIVVVEVSEEELLGCVKKLLGRIEECGIHLRADKYQFFIHSVKYSGLSFDSTGRRPDLDEPRAISKMSAPTNLGLPYSFLI